VISPDKLNSDLTVKPEKFSVQEKQ
jgi:hypothetical protein